MTPDLADALRHAREAQAILRRLRRGYGRLLDSLGEGVVGDDLDGAQAAVDLAVEDLEAVGDATTAAAGAAPSAAGAA